jgi:thiamine biosynthesis lipoprotein
MNWLRIFLLSNLCFSVLSQSERISLEGFAQGTMYHITYVDGQCRNLRDSINAELQRLDASLSTYQSQSIISKINRNEEVSVDRHFRTCFKQAKKIWKQSKGFLDPTVLPLTYLYGIRKPDLGAVTPEKLDSLMQFVGFEKIRLRGKRIQKSDPRVQLDFNAFAQGYSVDQIAEYLHNQEIHDFLVEIGGEVRASGRDVGGAKWIVGIEKPVVSDELQLPILHRVVLDNKAIATSGNYRKYVEQEKKYGHQINPHTGQCEISKIVSVTVIARDALTADAYATVFFVMGLDASDAFLSKHPELIAHILWDAGDGRLVSYASYGFTNLIEAMQDIK